MAISMSFNRVMEEFKGQEKFWKSIDEFEEYYLKRISETSDQTNWYTDRSGKERPIKPVWHNPPIEYEVWTEGYIATGPDAPAQLLGRANANNFAQACDLVMCYSRIQYITQLHETGSHVTHGTWDYDTRKLSSYGCEFHWNEELARKFYG